jgi:acyl carrier protein
MNEDHEQLQARVLAVLHQVAPDADTATLDPDRSFHDQVGIDSVDFLNFVIGLEDALDVRIAESDYPKLSTLKGCLEYLPTLCNIKGQHSRTIVIHQGDSEG